MFGLLNKVRIETTVLKVEKINQTKGLNIYVKKHTDYSFNTLLFP